jgi:DHA1 family bicyclomycin/chloramphenicol resistance-like MFS transporter
MSNSPAPARTLLGLAPESFAVAVLLTGLVALGPLSTDMYLPSLPAMKADLATDVAAVQATLSVFLLGLAVSNLFYGPLSDRFGRRPVLLGGVFLYVAAGAACAFAPSIGFLVAARALQGVGAASGMVLGRAVVRDIHGRERAAQVLAYMGTAMGAAPMIAPVAGGYLAAAFGWRANFVALTAFGAAILLALWAGLEETNRWRDPNAVSPGRIALNYGALLSRREYVGYVCAVGFVYSGLFSFISASSFVLVEFVGIPAEWFGYCFGTVVLGYMLGTFVAGRVTGRLGIPAMVLAGTLICAAAGALMTVFALAGWVHVAAIVGPMFLYMVGTGWVMPNATAGAIGPFPEKAGAAAALLGFLEMTLAAGVGAAVGRLHDGTQWPMALAILASGVAALALCVLLVRGPGRPSIGAERRERLNSV